MQLYISSYPNVGPLHCAAAVEWHEDGEGTSTRRHQPSTFSRLLYWIYPTGGRRFLCKMPVDNVHPQRFAPSIENFEKDTYIWVFNCLGWPGCFRLYVLKISAILVFRFFSCFNGQNKYKIRLLAYCIDHNKKWIK